MFPKKVRCTTISHVARRVWPLLLAGVALARALPAPGADLHATSAAFVPDREFPHLIRYCVEGWSLRDELGYTRQYAEEVRPGAVLHLFLQNRSRQPISITRVLLDGIDLSRHLAPRPSHQERGGVHAASFLLNDAATTPPAVRDRLEALGAPLWYQVRPNPVPPGGFTEVMVRLRRLPRVRHLKLGAASAAGETATATLSPARPAAVRIAAVNFGEGIGSLFLYLRREDGREFTLQSVHLDGTEVALPAHAPRHSFHGFLPVVVPLKPAWEFGSFHHIQATSRDGAVAATVLRARDPFFALGMWGYRNRGSTVEEQARDTSAAFRDHLFNTHMGMAGRQTGYLESKAGLQMLQEMGLRLMARTPDADTMRHPNLYARFLMDEPDAQDYSVDQLPPERRLGSFAQGLVERQQEWTTRDPRSLILLNVNLTYKPENWLVYGQLPDILCLDPYYQGVLHGILRGHPGRYEAFSHPYFVYAASEIARWASEPRPFHVILNSVFHVDREDPKRSFRYGTPEEKRIEFYYALAAGAKGISYWWFTPYGEYRGCGSDEPEAQAMMREQARLNAEARALEPLLATACPGAASGLKADPFTTAAPQWLMVRTLFVGTDVALILLINRDHLSDRIGTLYQPIPKARVTFQAPPWLQPTHAFRLAGGGVSPVALSRSEAGYVAPLENIELTEGLLLTTNPALADEVRARYQQLRPQLDRVLGAQTPRENP